MDTKPTYDELERRIKEIEKEAPARERAEGALRQSEEKYRALFENANEAVLVTQDGVIKFPNPKAQELYGYSKEELASKPFTYFIHEEDREMVRERYEKRIAGERVPGIYPYRIIDKNGQSKWIELKVVLFSWEERPATLCFMTDITERVLAEEELKKHRDHLEELVAERTKELKESEEKYRTLFENAGEAVYVAQDGRLNLSIPRQKSFMVINKKN